MLIAAVFDGERTAKIAHTCVALVSPPAERRGDRLRHRLPNNVDDDAKNAAALTDDRPGRRLGFETWGCISVDACTLLLVNSCCSCIIEHLSSTARNDNAPIEDGMKVLDANVSVRSEE